MPNATGSPGRVQLTLTDTLDHQPTETTTSTDRGNPNRPDTDGAEASDAAPGDGITRRGVLQGGAAVGLSTLTPGAERMQGDPNTAHSRIPAPFDELPTIEDPTDTERRRATVRLPDRAVPSEGPSPDYRDQELVDIELEAPAWALEAVRWRLAQTPADDLDRTRVLEYLIKYVCADEAFVTPDGRDAVDALLESVEGGRDDVQ